MPKVHLPPGCRSLRFEDGSRVVAGRQGGFVNVSEGQARAIDSMKGNGDAGLVGKAAFHEFGAVKKAGRWCKSCQPARLWNPWNDTCPRCGAATEPEQVQ